MLSLLAGIEFQMVTRVKHKGSMINHEGEGCKLHTDRWGCYLTYGLVPNQLLGY